MVNLNSGAALVAAVTCYVFSFDDCVLNPSTGHDSCVGLFYITLETNGR